MATRTTSLESKIMQALTEWDSSAESPATLQEVMGEFGTGDKETYDALGALEDAGKVNSEGRWLTSVWFIGKAEEKTSAPVQDKPKRTRRTKAQMQAARAEEAKRTAYAANVAESQDMDAQHATPRVVTPPVEPKNGTPVPRAEFTSEGVKVLPAETPVIAENGETVTVPVDENDPTAGRRELDASKGEKIIAEDDMRSLILALKRENAELKAKQSAEIPKSSAELIFHEPKNGPCPGNEIPAVPEGVHPHTWELAHDANTETARAYYMRQVEAQIAEHEETAMAEEHMREILANQEDTPPF